MTDQRLILTYEEGPQLGVRVLRNNATVQELLRLGRAINSLQDREVENIIRVERELIG